MWKSTKRPRPRGQDASYTHKSGLVCVRSGSGFSCYRFVMLPAARQRHNTRITYARPAEGTSTQPCAVAISLSLSLSLFFLRDAREKERMAKKRRAGCLCGRPREDLTNFSRTRGKGFDFCAEGGGEGEGGMMSVGRIWLGTLQLVKSYEFCV